MRRISKSAATAKLDKLEKQIDTGISNVGLALMEIQEQELYKLTHETFEKYCSDRWGFKKSRAYQLIEAEKVKSRLSTIVDKPISKESHLREVSKIPEKEQAKMVAAVLEQCEAEKREPTAKDFKAAAKPFVQETNGQDDHEEQETAEPVVTVPDWRKLKAKTIATGEAMQRVIDDLHEAKPATSASKKSHDLLWQSMETIRRGWK